MRNSWNLKILILLFAKIWKDNNLWGHFWPHLCIKGLINHKGQRTCSISDIKYFKNAQKLKEYHLEDEEINKEHQAI